MKYTSEAYEDEVEPALDAFKNALESLADLDWGPYGDGECSQHEIEQVIAAGEGLVTALANWIPDLVPEARTLVEVLETIASWHEDEQTARMAANAASFMEELQAEDYGGDPLTDPEAFPDFEKFVDDLRATLELVKEALP